MILQMLLKIKIKIILEKIYHLLNLTAFYINYNNELDIALIKVSMQERYGNKRNNK